MNFKKFLPYVLAIAIFAVVTGFHFSPLFSGKFLKQGDIVNAAGMSQEARDFRKEYKGEEPLWTNSMFSGMPAYQISALYPGNLLTSVDKVFHGFLPHPSGYIFLYFVGFFILLLCLEINPWLAIIGALAYGFSSYFFIILEAGHNSKANAIGYLAPLLGGIILLMRNKYWLGFAVTTLFMALELNANHPQIAYYGFMLFGCVLLGYFFKAFKEKTTKAFFIGVALFIASSIIGFLPNAGSLLCTYEYGNYTIRAKSDLTITTDNKSNQENKTSGLDKDYATAWSYGVGETFTMLIPNFKGGASTYISNVDKDALKKVDGRMRDQVAQSMSYFGDQPFTSGPVYIGAIIMLLAFLGLFIIDHPLKWALFGATLLSMMLAWGKNFMGLTSLFMDVLPMYNKFRAVSMILIIAELTIPLLAILALDKFIKLGNEANPLVKLPFTKKTVELKKIFIISVAVVGGFCLIGWVAPSLINTFVGSLEEAQMVNAYKQQGATAEQLTFIPELMSNLEKARQVIFSADARRSFVFIALAGLFLFLYLTKKLKLELLLVALGIFILADLWNVANRYLNEKNFSTKDNYALPEKTMADEQILQDKSLDYRVLNLTASPFNDATTSFYHKSIGGYHGAKLRKYQEIIDFHLDKEISEFYGGLNQAAGNDSLLNSLTSKIGVLNMLNTKYFILPTREQSIALKNPQANGNVWFIKNVKTVANSDEEITGLATVNTKSEIIVQQKNKELAPVSNSYNGDGNIKLNSYKANHLVYESESKDKNFAVFSEIYYPKGWNAYIDGALTPHTCVNYVLRGMEVPAGKHKIEFKFEPNTYKTANTVALIGSIIALLSIAIGFYFSTFKSLLAKK